MDIIEELRALPSDIKNIVIDYQEKPITIGLKFSKYFEREHDENEDTEYLYKDKYTMFIDTIGNNLYKCGIIDNNLSEYKFLYIDNIFCIKKLKQFITDFLNTNNSINHVEMYFVNTRKFGYKQISVDDENYMDRLIYKKGVWRIFGFELKFLNSGFDVNFHNKIYKVLDEHLAEQQNFFI